MSRSGLVAWYQFSGKFHDLLICLNVIAAISGIIIALAAPNFLKGLLISMGKCRGLSLGAPCMRAEWQIALLRPGNSRLRHKLKRHRDESAAGGRSRLMFIASVKGLGASPVIVSEFCAEQWNLAMVLGAGIAIDPMTGNSIAMVRSETNGKGADYSAETSGIPASSIRCCA